MCGIVGIIQPEEKGRVDSQLLRSMNESLLHRGPDDEGYHVEGPVGFAMRRLKIIDLEGGHQPLSNETEEIWTIFNGEIYNYQDLRDSLIKQGHRFRTQSDTEVIVHLYEEEGEEFVGKLRGMFAIALWDRRRRKLLLYRDRVGIKPLHYWCQNGTFLFASEIKAILVHPEVRRELSLAALSDYLSFLYIPEPETIYREIHKLSPGHFLRYQEGKVEIQCYWDFAFSDKPWVGETEWIRRLHDELDESIRLHRMSDVPLGAFLSGGVDSSTVVAWMSRQSQEPVKTYSIGFGDKRFNELPFARQVARRFQTDHHEKYVQADAVNLLPKILTGFDEPFADSSAIPTYWVSGFAREEVTVALSGDGGDELFGGYLWTQKELWLEQYRRLPLFFRQAVESVFLRSGYRPHREGSAWSAFQRFFFDARQAPADSFARRAMCFQPWMKQELLQPWVLDALDHHDSVHRFRSLFEQDAAKYPLDKLLYLDAKVYLPADLLTKVDRMSMLHSLEVRVPLLDHKVVELAASIPFSFKQRGRTTKYILKQAMGTMLPRGVLRQRKQGFSVPLERWFREDLAGLTQEILLEENSAACRYFRPDYLKWLLREHEAGRQRFGSQLYALLVFEIWHRLQGEARGQHAGTVALKDLVS